MSLVSRAIRKIEGPLIFLDPIPRIKYNEIVEVQKPNGKTMLGRCTLVSDSSIVVEAFGGTDGLNMENTSVKFSGDVFKIPVSDDMINRVFNGVGHPIDGGPDIIPEAWLDVNGEPINPYAREYPRDLIETGLSCIDTLTSLVCGQKLPIFSGQGLPHDELAARIVNNATIYKSAEEEQFLIVFAGIGIKNDVSLYFQSAFSRTKSNIVMFNNLASDPTIERLLTPRIALTTAEYFAFKKGYKVLVILTDMTNYCEALREISASKDEIPSRKGFPGYMYSDLASIYERAGRVKGEKGSITQLPILTMPNDDINNPVPDLTGYITEGQIVLSRSLFGRGVVPPMDILTSLSRIMKDAIVGKTREDHADVMNQLYSGYSKALDVRALQSIVGEEGLTQLDKKYMTFAEKFEKEFLAQPLESRFTFDESLDRAWKILSILPKSELIRIKSASIEKYYKG
ncbi:MAG TPA: V-type ATP synthase subunit B [Candidatus Lokiarchaeia archaeon]|nr:V-type ATP synthase subunit B [Candidatus Lokiarchaeia archaeon]